MSHGRRDRNVDQTHGHRDRGVSCCLTKGVEAKSPFKIKMIEVGENGRKTRLFVWKMEKKTGNKSEQVGTAG